MTHWDELIYFFSLADANIRSVALGSVLISGASALVGAFSYLQRKSLAGDAVSHAVLPGICLVYLITADKQPLELLIGALGIGLLAWGAITLLTGRTRLKADTVISLVLACFFGLGTLMLTHIQAHQRGGDPSGLDRFLFGRAAALVGLDVTVFAWAAVGTALAVVVFQRGLLAISFDRSYARLIGLPVGILDRLLTVLTVLAIVLGIQSVGVVLMSAMLITPPAAARYLTRRGGWFLVASVLIGGISGLGGALISYLAPGLPTGPAIVVVASVLALTSFLFSPGQGVVRAAVRRGRQRIRIRRENLLKFAYHQQEQRRPLTADLLEAEGPGQGRWRGDMRTLISRGQMHRGLGEVYSLTSKGQQEAARVVRLHRLWELYLAEKLRIAPDHVHDDAESIEHVITPEIEARLLELLDRPSVDPHGEPIPIPTLEGPAAQRAV